MNNKSFCAGWVGLFTLLIAGCGPAETDSKPSGASEPPPSQSSGSGAGGLPRQRQAEFLNRLRQSDPSYQVIQKAVLNQNNELGLVLSRSVEMESIPALMKSMLTQLNKEFPGQDLTVIAYAPTQPPVKIGTGHLDSRTRAMTYTAERQ